MTEGGNYERKKRRSDAGKVDNVCGYIARKGRNEEAKHKGRRNMRRNRLRYVC